MTIYTKLLADFLAKKARRAYVAEQPFALDRDLSPRFEEYARGVLVRRETFPIPAALGGRINDSSRFSYALRLRDIASTFWFMLTTRGVVDIYIGVEATNFLVGFLFKKLGKVRLVVYSVLDYWPQRFPSRLTNWLFHVLDRYCADKADVIWNTSEEARELRERIWRKSFRAAQVTIPSLNPTPEDANYGSRPRHSVAYVGSLDEKWGLYLAVDAVAIVKETTPDIVFHVIGDGKIKEDLTRYAEEKAGRGTVIVHGPLNDEKTLEIVLGCRAGLAPYLPGFARGHVKFVDASKAKYYAYCGVPTVLSNAVPISSRLIREYNAGLVVEPEKVEVAGAIKVLLADNDAYMSMVRGCREMASEFDSDKFFQRTLSRIAMIRKRAGSEEKGVPRQ